MAGVRIASSKMLPEKLPLMTGVAPPNRVGGADGGEPHLAAMPLICFEWHQRPENVRSGYEEAPAASPG